VIGQFIFYKGNDIHSYLLALFGRFIYGLGGESLTVATSMLEATWFMGKELSFAVSIDYGIANFAAFSNDCFEPIIYSAKNSLAFVFWVGFLLCVLSLIAATAVYFIDGKRLQADNLESQHHNGKCFQLSDIFAFKWDFWIISLATAFSTLVWVLFNNIASEFFQLKFGFSLHTTGTLIGLEALVIGCSVPFLGCALDRFGHRIVFGILIKK